MTPFTSEGSDDRKHALRSGRARWHFNRIFAMISVLIALLSVMILAVLVVAIFWQGTGNLGLGFLSSGPSPDVREAGIRPALFGTIWVCMACAMFTLPIGVGTAILLEEFPPRNLLLRALHGFLQLNIANLAGVPSVVYGIIGLTAFVSMFQAFGSPHDPSFEIGVKYYDQYLSEGDHVLFVPVAGRAAPSLLEPGMPAVDGRGQVIEVNVIAATGPLPRDTSMRNVTLREDAEAGRINFKKWYYFRVPFGRGVLAGSLTLMLVILPIVIIASQEALRAVPNSLREASLGMGATTWQSIWNVSLPVAVPGVMTGSILAMSRAIGEAAPILMIAGIIYIANPPGHLMDDFSVMPLQIYNWAQRPQVDFHALAASGILVLLAMLLFFNSLAVLIRYKLQSKSL